MVTEDGLLRITYNGEIYNYKTLCKKLEAKGCRFRSNSDTEVLLHLYREYGHMMVEHLRGMYAFALWNDEQSGLFLVRDPFGIKPLYYADDGYSIRVAIQVKTFLAAGGADTSLEPAGHVGFFLWGYVPEPFTLYKGIRALPAGTILWVAQGDSHPRLKTFCDVAQEIARPFDKNSSTTREEIAETLSKALRDSVQHHMVSDVPVGVFLSAGLDSTSMAALAVRCSQNPLRSLPWVLKSIVVPRMMKAPWPRWRLANFARSMKLAGCVAKILKSKWRRFLATWISRPSTASTHILLARLLRKAASR